MNAVPPTILPVELWPALGGFGCELPLTMVDDVQRDAEALESVTLGLGLVDLHVSNVVTFAMDPRERTMYRQKHMVACMLCADVRD